MCGTTANLRNIYASKYACMQVRVRAAFRGVYRHVIPQFIYRCATCTHTDSQPTLQPMVPFQPPQPMPMQFQSPPQFQPLPAMMDAPREPPLPALQPLTLSHGMRVFGQKAETPATPPVLALANSPANVEPPADASGAADEGGSKSDSVIVECACMLQAPQYNVVTFAMIAVSFGELRWPPPWGQCDV